MNKKSRYAVILVIVIAISAVGILGYSLFTKPTATFTYVGENTSDIPNFPTDNGLFYSWNLTTTNFIANGIGTVVDSATQPLVSKYPELSTITTSSGTALRMDCTSYTGKMDKQLVVIYANSELTSEQIQSLTSDLNTILAPAIVEWFS